jgi:ABC-2 type transport system ATP-binding protein
MKMLTGNLAPSAGEVLVNGASLHADPKTAKRHLGYLPEQPPVYPELTVDEYLRYCAALHGIARREQAAAVESAKRDCGLADVGARLVGNLSKGYQQRVGIAQAIIHRPPVVILDEPTVGLDPIQIREIRKLIADLGRNHSVIVSSHILSEIEAVCSRVMIIALGRVVYNESLAETAAGKFVSVLASFRNPPEQSALTAIAGVKSATHLGDGHFRIDRNGTDDPRAAIAEAAARGGWSLYELSAQRRTLEDIFVELTLRDAARAAA